MSTITMIVADDHEVYREGLCSILRNELTIEIIAEAINGQDLINKILKRQPDIVLTDIIMPVKDGIAATKEIIKQFPAIGIIATTVSNDDNLIVDMLEAGASGYLMKSAHKHEIIEAIQIVYNHGTYFCRNTSTQLAHIIKRSGTNSYQNTKPPALSDVEINIIQLLCEEKTSKEIAQQINLSVRTIESWRMRIQNKLNVKGTAGIIVYAVKNGIYTIGK